MNTATSQLRRDGNTCEGCKHYLGGGCCRINEEKECADSEYELYEPKDDDDWIPATWKEIWQLMACVIICSALWGILMYKFFCWIF